MEVLSLIRFVNHVKVFRMSQKFLRVVGESLMEEVREFHDDDIKTLKISKYAKRMK